MVNWEPNFAIGLAQRLDLAITFSPRLYAKDIDIALKIITTLFDYESKQNSSTLVSARTKEFAKVRKWKPRNPLFSVPRRYQQQNCKTCWECQLVEDCPVSSLQSREELNWVPPNARPFKGFEPGTWGLEIQRLSARPPPLTTNNDLSPNTATNMFYDIGHFLYVTSYSKIEGNY